MQNERLIRVVAAVVERDGKYLISQRNPRAVFPLKWEFPGGRVEADEDDAEALEREMKEKLDADVEVGPLLERKVHCYDDFAVDFRVYRCNLKEDRIRAAGVADFRWLGPEELAEYDFPPADESAIALLAGVEKGQEDDCG